MKPKVWVMRQYPDMVFITVGSQALCFKIEDIHQARMDLLRVETDAVDGDFDYGRQKWTDYPDEPGDEDPEDLICGSPKA